jgi:dGTPase
MCATASSSHDGEVHNTLLRPQWNKTEDDIRVHPRQEGRRARELECPHHGGLAVVRISDTNAYIGQDIEDAIRYNILTREELPADAPPTWRSATPRSSTRW